MSEHIELPPLVVRTEDDIRADWDVRANAGLSLDDPNWVDTRQGSAFHLATAPSVIEFANAYDRINESVARAILSTSWGSALDAIAASYDDERIGATYATGAVTFTGDNGTLIGTGVRVSVLQVDPDIDPPVFETTEPGTISAGTLTLPIRALEPGVEGNVGAGTMTVLLTGVAGINSITNAEDISGGADEETDDALKRRLKTLFGGKGNATISEYVREALKWPGVGYATVEPAFNGPGTVRVSILSETGDPLNASVATALQQHFDPVAGQGKGWAPINHIVTVQAPAATIINVSGVPTFRDGYSLDGGNGTIALRSAIVEQVQSYLDDLKPGDDVIYNAVEAQFFRIEGVLNVGTLRIGTATPPTGTTDIAIAPTDVARAGTVTLT